MLLLLRISRQDFAPHKQLVESEPSLFTKCYEKRPNYVYLEHTGTTQIFTIFTLYVLLILNLKKILP